MTADSENRMMSIVVRKCLVRSGEWFWRVFSPLDEQAPTVESVSEQMQDGGAMFASRHLLKPLRVALEGHSTSEASAWNDAMLGVRILNREWRADNYYCPSCEQEAGV